MVHTTAKTFLVVFFRVVLPQHGARRELVDQRLQVRKETATTQGRNGRATTLGGVKAAKTRDWSGWQCVGREAKCEDEGVPIENVGDIDSCLEKATGNYNRLIFYSNEAKCLLLDCSEPISPVKLEPNSGHTLWTCEKVLPVSKQTEDSRRAPFSKQDTNHLTVDRPPDDVHTLQGKEKRGGKSIEDSANQMHAIALLPIAFVWLSTQ